MKLEHDFSKGYESVVLNFDGDWNKDNYVMMPAAVYAGNRFKKLYQNYPPFVPQGERTADSEILISDIPALNPEEGVSEIILRSGDMATPAVCIYDPAKQFAYVLLGVHKTELGYTGWEIHESDDRKSCKVIYSAISERPYRYSMCNSHSDTEEGEGEYDKSIKCTPLHFELIEFHCKSVEALYARFLTFRKVIGEDNKRIDRPDYDKLMDVYIEKYNKFNWKPEEGYYMSGVGDNIHQEWQSGWTGGGMFLKALYKAAVKRGDRTTIDRVLSSMDTCFDKLQDEKGWFFPVYYQGKKYGDDFHHMLEGNILMSRKQADMIYFLILAYNDIEAEEERKAKWLAGIRKAVDAMMRIYNKYGRFGQFIDTDTDEILIGDTASAGLMPGALISAYNLFGNEEYKKAALETGKYYYENYTKKGIANGGPGEILQCCDSEAAYALVESYVVLYENTKDEYWLEAAKSAANLFATWVMSYNFEFPEDCEFGRLGMKTVGSVFANCQNKHSAPGICSMSGDTLYKLYKYTENKLYYELIKDIAWDIPQYTSTDERTIHDPAGNPLPSGYSCERVNTSDWEGKDFVGGVWVGSCCWCETAAMLTATDFKIEEDEITLA